MSLFRALFVSAYLADEKGVGKNVFYLSGIEAKQGQDSAAAVYAADVKKKLLRLTVPGDAVVIGTGNSHFESLPGFTRVLGYGDQRIFMRDKD